jgi:hypothetical protein
LTAEERKLSFVSEPEAGRRSTTAMLMTDQLEQDKKPAEERKNPFELCEQKTTNGTELYDVDFMVRLNFMARRLTEQIGKCL